MGSMADFTITIIVKDVAEGDVTGLAQSIFDENANDFDAKLGDFKIRVGKLDRGNEFTIDWKPEEA